MLPIIQLGPLAVQAPGLVLLAGLWLALNLAEREAQRLARRLGPAGAALTSDAIYSLALAGLGAGLVGARLVYVLRYFSAYAADPLGILALNPATLAQREGVLIGLVAALLWGARRRLPLWPTLDALAPGVAVMGVAFALAHLASGDAFGAPATVPWRIYLWDDYRHPSQVYELLAALGVLGVWWGRARSRADQAGAAGSGEAFLVVVALMAGARLFLEAFRGDSVLLAGGVRAAQVWAWLALGTSLGLLSSRARRSPEALPPG